jgi:hypothetical protein
VISNPGEEWRKREVQEGGSSPGEAGGVPMFYLPSLKRIGYELMISVRRATRKIVLYSDLFLVFLLNAIIILYSRRDGSPDSRKPLANRLGVTE